MHVHVSRNNLSAVALARLLTFRRSNYWAFVKFSKRDRVALDRWSRIEMATTRDFLAKARTRGSDGYRYVAVNLCNEHTVEFRIFRGTLNSRSILKNIGLVESLVSFARSASVQQMKMPNFLEHVAREAADPSRTKAERSILDATLKWIAPLATEEQSMAQASLVGEA
jgi:hypothetical protein